MGFERFIGEFDIDDFAEGSFIEGGIKKQLDFIEIF